MHTTERTEAYLFDANNALVVSPGPENDELIGDFFGSVITPDELSSGAHSFAQKTVYLGCDVSKVRDSLDTAERVFVIRDCTHDYDGGGDKKWAFVDRARVPVRVHGVGVYYRRFFDPGSDHFTRICAEHAFQSLTESTKPGTAHRTGIYLTPVEQNGNGLHFRLLRCSTNLSDPSRSGPPFRHVARGETAVPG